MPISSSASHIYAITLVDIINVCKQSQWAEEKLKYLRQID